MRPAVLSSFTACALATLLAAPLSGQDRRRVSEPVLPPACATLEARLTAPAGVLSEAAEGRPDTARIQSAIDACPSGRAVQLTRRDASNVFLSGPLRFKAGVTLVIDAHTALFASRDPRDYDVEPGSCGILAEMGRRGAGCKPLLLAEDAPGSGVMGRGAIDGRGGAVMRGQDLTWWELAKQAKVLDLQQTCPRLLVVRRSNGFTLSGLTLRNSPNFHVVAESTDGFTAWRVKIKTPKTARNSDGIDPSSSTNVTIAHCLIDTGDDNVAIKAGNTGPTTNVTIAHNRFWNGHGMSIGSNTNGGVRAVRVTDLTIDGADNGLRIKSDRSRGGLVEDVAYEDVCLRNVANPIVLTSMYTTFPGTLLPVYRDVRLKDVRSLTGGWTTLLGLDAEHRIGVSLDNVHVDGQRPEQAVAAHADVRIGPRRGSYVPHGETVSADDHGAVPGGPPACEGRFEPFPDLPEAPAAAVKVPEEDPTLYVAASGNGDYWSIQRAIDVAPPEGAVISVAPGTYRESLVVTKPNVRIRSPYPDARRTVIRPGPRVGAVPSSPSATRPATVEVLADGFFLENLTVGVEENAAEPPLALRVTGRGATLVNVPLLGEVEGSPPLASSSSPAAAANGEGSGIRVRVTNPLDAARPTTSVEVTAAALAGRAVPADLVRLTVTDGRTGREVLSQAVDEDGDGAFDRLVFQADFTAGETREFTLARGEARKPHLADYRVYGRFVRERHDDFAWENDRVAFRFYGQALETFEKEPLTSSALDAWSKRTARLVLNDWYLADDYHRDHGEGGDFYSAGRTRGCGGSGLWLNGALAVSRNFRASRVLAPGPIRLVFEVDYPEWDTPRLEAKETKRVTLDAGSHLNKLESFYRLPGGEAITWAAGIRRPEGVTPRVDRERGIMRTWEHQTRYGENGWLGCGVIVDPAVILDTREEGGNHLVIARTSAGSPATWYAGSGWDRSGHFADAAAWDRYLDAFAARLRSPLVVEVGR